MKRLVGLDVIRGIGILLVVFLHSATFNYANIVQVDFEHPPLIITVIGFMLMWAGLFALVSGVAYACTTTTRLSDGRIALRQVGWQWVLAGGWMLVLHYVYFLVLAPKLIDFEHGQHQYALLPGLIVAGRLLPLTTERIFYSTTLSMIAWNLLLIAPLWRPLLALSEKNPRRADLIWGGLGTLVILASLLRIPMYPLTARVIEGRNWLVALILGFVFNKNNPILPYLAFGLFGAWLGLSLAVSEKPRRVLGRFALIGVFWLVAGVVGLFLLPDTMLEREVDLFWYCIILFQLGLFLLLIVGTLALIDFSERWGGALRRLASLLARIGRVSLTIFMLETVLSQTLVRLGDALWPGWNETINVCLAFGALNALLWVGVVALWGRWNCRYGLEWLSVRVFSLLGRPSDKMTGL